MTENLDESGWEFEAFDDGAKKRLLEKQIEEFRSFLSSHAQQLLDVEDALDESLGSQWDFFRNPVALELGPHESTSVLELVATDNKVLSKVIAVFVTLCDELKQLQEEAEQDYYAPLHLYGESCNHSPPEEGDIQLLFGKMIPVLQRISVFVDRINQVVKNVVQQLAMIYSPAHQHSMDMRHVTLTPVFKHLGQALLVLTMLDEIIAKNPILNDHLDQYRRMLRTVHGKPDIFGLTQDQLAPFERLFSKLKGQLFDNMLFQNCVDQPFDDMTVTVSSNNAFREHFLHSLQQQFQSLERVLGTEGETVHRKLYLGLCCQVVLCASLFHSLDKRLVRSMWDVNKRVPAVHMFGTIIIAPGDFLQRRLPAIQGILDKKAATDLSMRRAFLSHLDSTIASTVQSLYLQTCVWMTNMDSAFRPKTKDKHRLRMQHQYIQQGVALAYRLRHLGTTFINLHTMLGTAVKKGHVKALFRIVELLKAIELTYFRQSMFVANACQMLAQDRSRGALVLLQRQQSDAERSKAGQTYSRGLLDVLAAFNLVMTNVHGPRTRLRELAVEIGLKFASQRAYVPPESLSELQSFLDLLSLVSHLQTTVKEVCDTSFLYWHRHLADVYFQALYTTPEEAHRSQYAFAAFRDCLRPLKAVEKKTGETLVDPFKEQLIDLFRQHIITPLCEDIETDLRFQILTDVIVKSEEKNPLQSEVKDLTPFIELAPITFDKTTIDVKAEVTHYLDTTFYNITTVALHDWRSYGQMKILAEAKYGLSLQESHLPSGTLEQGLDVLQILRNIHMFVAKYNYNLNNQIFVEKYSKNKFLNTINIQHFANSIRTHGTGIINTAVNFTYQFLSQKLKVFSQFLFDDHIKSKLMKDIKYFRQARHKTDQQYPFERASKFTKAIRQLGVNSKGQSCLDQFRELITQIGNGMGYIRMLRSGGLNMCSNAIRFVPDLEDIPNFSEMLEDEQVSEETKRAAKNLDEVLKNLASNFAEGTDYFKMLVNTFAKPMRSDKNKHLKNFYIIVPPLTIAFVEHMISSKDRITKKNKEGAAFTDDGFAMGIAYILKVLDQYEAFDALHWFQQCKAHYHRQRQEVQQSKTSKRSDGKLQEAMSLSLKRIQRYEREMDMLFYSITSARIFFRADKTAAEEAAEEQAATQNGEEAQQEQQQQDNGPQQQQQEQPAAQQPAADSAGAPPPPPPPPPPAPPAQGSGAPPPPPPPLPNL